MSTVTYLILGLVLVAPVLYYAHRRAKAARGVLAIALIVAAVIYVVFATATNDGGVWVGIELIGVLAYGAIALLGLRGSAWWLVLGWTAHPLWDIALHHAGPGAGFTPDWYAWACVSFDLSVAGYIMYRISHPRGLENARTAG